MRSLFVEDMFEHSSVIILFNDILEGLVDEGRSALYYGLRDGHGKSPGNDDIGFTRFFVE